MRHRRCISTVLLIAFGVPVWGQLIPNLGGQRVGISAFQSLKLGVGARAVGMGEAFVAVANDASAIFWNPAAAVEERANAVLASHTEYVAGIRHDFLGVMYHLSSSDVIGCAVTSLHMDDMEITTETQPHGTGRYFTFGDIGVGLTYSRRMTDQFSFGATFRYVEERLDLLKMRSFMADLGTYYWTGLGTARFAVVVTNFGEDVAPEGVAPSTRGQEVSAYQSFSLPTVFKLGFALEPYQDAGHRVTTSIQLNHPNDNAENLRIGVEYAWDETFFLRVGLKRTVGQQFFGEDRSSEESLTAGAGVRVPFFGNIAAADYAFADFGRLGGVHRFSLGFTW